MRQERHAKIALTRSSWRNTDVEDLLDDSRKDWGHPDSDARGRDILFRDHRGILNMDRERRAARGLHSCRDNR